MDEIDNTKGFLKRSSGHSELNSSESAVKSHKHAQSQQKPTNRFLCDLTDAGKYSYAVCCGLALRNLYGDSTDNNSKFVEDFIKTLLKHLELKPQVEVTVLAFTHGEGDDDPVPLIKVLKDEALVRDCGTVVLLRDLLTVSVSSGVYDARSRTLAKHMCLLLQIDPDTLVVLEDAIVDELTDDTDDHQPTEEELYIKKKQENRRQLKKAGLVAVATVGGGVLLGLTGGLAAPMLAVGLGTLLGTGGAILGSTAGIALIGSLFGVAGAGLGAYKMQRRVAGVSEFKFEELSHGKSLHVTLAVPGWVTNQDPDCRHVWWSMADSCEQFVLCYETKELIEVGQAMDYLTSFAVTAATQQALQYTIFAGVLAAITWPAALLSASCFIDNPWSVCMERAVAVGRLLAEVLIAREQGHRPVTLIGFSIGARVIFYCLLEMARNKRSAGVIEDAILLGAPVSTCQADWETVSKVVSGRLVNGYSRTDWQLKFVYRATSLKFDVAGLGPIAVASRRLHNVDLTDVIQCHADYATHLNTVMSVLGVKVVHKPPEIPTEFSSPMHIGSSPTVTVTNSGGALLNSGSLRSQSHTRLSDLQLCDDATTATTTATHAVAAAHGVTPRRVQSSSSIQQQQHS